MDKQHVVVKLAQGSVFAAIPALIIEWYEAGGEFFQTLLIVTLAMFVLDFLTGVAASWLNGRKITSDGFRRSIGKGIQYLSAVILSILFDNLLSHSGFSNYALQTFVLLSISITEAKSVLENMDEMSGDFSTDIFRKVISILSRRLEEPLDGTAEENQSDNMDGPDKAGEQSNP